jgi:hypothetical protein
MLAQINILLGGLQATNNLGWLHHVGNLGHRRVYSGCSPAPYFPFPGFCIGTGGYCWKPSSMKRQKLICTKPRRSHRLTYRRYILAGPPVPVASTPAPAWVSAPTLSSVGGSAGPFAAGSHNSLVPQPAVGHTNLPAIHAAVSQSIQLTYIRYNPRQQPCSNESADTKSLSG